MNADSELMPDMSMGGESGVTRTHEKKNKTQKINGIERKRLQTGNTLLTEPVVPSGASHPVEAQRDFRGKIVVVILILIVVVAIQLIVLVRRVAERSIIYAPTAERIGAATGRRATSQEMENFAKTFVATMEGWNSTSAKKLSIQAIPYLHPSLHQSIKAQYEAIANSAKTLWQSRVAVPLGSVSGGEKAGVITLAVYYQQAELVGRTIEDRKMQAIINKAAWVQIIQDVATDENPLGLLVVQYKTFEKEEAKKVGIPDLWDKYLEGNGP